MQTKFTSDGKKVAIVGKLNAQETIVQEIFVTEAGAEIPSGENFVVKSLHDSVVISWKDKELKRITEQNELLISRLESENKQYDAQLEASRKRFKEESKILGDKLHFIAAAVKNTDESSFNTLLAFLEGRIKYLVENNTYSPKILTFTEAVENKSNSDYWSGLNLISLFGNDDGTLQFKVHDYYDGYKSFIQVIPCETEEGAIFQLTQLIGKAKEYNQYIIAEAKKYDIKLNANMVKAYKDKQKAELERNIKMSLESIEKNKAKIIEIEDN